MNTKIQNAMVGHTFSAISESRDELIFDSDSKTVRFFHKQDCCESVQIEDVIGDLDDLVGSEILLAEEATDHIDDRDSQTWTFYKFATMKGAVTVRWLGESNGYYSESVDVEVKTKS